MEKTTIEHHDNIPDITLSEYREGLEKAPPYCWTDQYITKNAEKALLVACRSVIRLAQYGAVFKEVALENGASEEVVDAAIAAINDEYIEIMRSETGCSNEPEALICDALRQIDKYNSVHEKERIIGLLPLMCGTGKSTGISHMMRRSIEEQNGILIVTDSVERMNDYMAPYDADLKQYLKDNANKVTIMHQDNRIEAYKTMQYCPVLIITTQRLQGIITGSDIQKFLNWEGGKRKAVLIDEKPLIKEVKVVNRREVNNIAGILADAIPCGDSQLKKAWVKYWEDIRRKFYDAVDECEERYSEGESYVPYMGDSNAATEDDDSEALNFMRYLEMNRPTEDVLNLENVADVLNVVSEGGIMYSNKSTDQYRAEFYCRREYWEKLRAIDASVLILDGTAGVHPDYDNLRGLGVYDAYWLKRQMDNFTITFVDINTSKNSLTVNDKSGKRKRLIIKYLDDNGFDKQWPLFTYMNTEAYFKRNGYKTVAHFGAIKGRNDMRDSVTIAQVGLFTFPRQYYMWYWLFENPEYLENMEGKTAAEINDELKQLEQRKEVDDIQERMQLADLEQNFFRGAIRRPDFVKKMNFYVLCDVKKNKGLINQARETYGPQSVKIEVVESEAIELEKTMQRQGANGKETNPQRIIKAINDKDKGTEYTPRQIRDELGITEGQWSGAVKNKVIKAILERDNVGKGKYQKKI